MTYPEPEPEPQPQPQPSDENPRLSQPSDQTPPVTPWDQPPYPGQDPKTFNPQPAPPGTTIIYRAEEAPSDAIEEA